DETLGEARARLRIGIAGRRASELTHFVYVPEGFSRRYADMRARNESIALVSQTVFMFLFVLLGAGVGSALLLRKGWLEWRTALGWGGLIALLFGLNTVNQLPLSWMAYDTALSAANFVLQQLGASLAIAILGTPIIAFFLLAGESLGRRAFPDHVQQWRFWSPEVASSNTALGLTIGAYLLVGIQVGYVVLFYLGTQRLEGWWSPADALVQPDLLATYLPWLQAVSTALFASFWEESVFRAVPIAGAALLGARYGYRSAWIWTAVVVQAVVFAAAHANYPQQPPYARVVELTLPALLWGIVYLRFGLIPTVLAHFIYDLSLISVVLFASRALLDQMIIVAVGLVPLGVVLRARTRGRARSRPPEGALNGAWLPRQRRRRGPVEPMPEAPPEASGAPSPGLAGRGVPVAGRWRVPGWAVPLAGGAGAILWLGAHLAGPAPPRLWGGRDAALAVASAELQTRGAPVTDWSLSATVTAGPTGGRDYVYEVAGAEAYAELSGSYFDVPYWIVRLVDWGGDPEDRVEEYRVWVGPDGAVSRVTHALPEARAGAALRVDSARHLAYRAVADALGLERARLREVEAEQESRPNRTDWTFTFSEPGLLEAVEGEARVRVRLAGDQVVDVDRSVRVPEDWTRERRRVESRRLIMAGGLALLLAICFGAAAIASVVAWSRGALAPGVGSRLAVPILLGIGASTANSWPASVAGFTTAQPWGLQAGGLAMALALAGIIAAAATGLVGALAITWLRESPRPSAPRGASVALGLLFGGVVVAGQRAFASAPPLGSYSGAAASLPFLDEPLRAVTPYLLVTSALLMVLAVREHFRDRPLVQTAVVTLLAVAAVVVVPGSLQSSLASWGLAGLGVGLFLYAAMRVGEQTPRLVPGMVGAVFVLGSLSLAWEAPYAGSRVGGLLAALVVAALAWVWTREMVRGEERPGPDLQSAEGARASVGSV
ncbi:MAG TPA: CPBP family glutamic-type intramembrane protease, partial [Longimicrobiales bacterium]|nr:CPBP family glutamic-type intramembrane protease [Longimicrobiales bacterium]